MIRSFAFVAFMALSFLLKMVSVAGLMIRYVAVLCHLIPKLLRNAALKDNGDGIVSALRTQRYGIGQRAGEIHDLAGYWTDHSSRRNGNDRALPP